MSVMNHLNILVGVYIYNLVQHNDKFIMSFKLIEIPLKY